MKLSEDRDYRGAIDRFIVGARNSRHCSVLEDKRVRVIPTDGRNYILATPKYYDVITAEPSNPWIAGIANLYTREFYQVIKSKIKDDGIFAQWFHNYSMSPDDFRMVFRTFAEAFPYVSLWSMKESDFLLIGSKQEHGFDYAAVKKIYDNNSMLRSDLEYLGLSDVYAVQGFYRMGKENLLDFSKGAEINTDDGAQLEFSAPKNLRRATTELNRQMMAPYIVDSPPWLKNKSLPVPGGDASFLYGAILRGERCPQSGFERVGASDPFGSDESKVLSSCKRKFFWIKTRALRRQSRPRGHGTLARYHFGYFGHER